MSIPIVNKRVLAGIAGAALLTVSFATAAVTTAVFTDSVPVGANVFTSGSIDINAAPSSNVASFANMMPGDQVTAALTVSNGGSNQLRYAMTTSATNPDGKDLRDQLQLTVRTEDVGGGCSAFNGTVVVATGPLATAAIGSPTQGSQPGDRVLNGSASESLCFRVSLPLSTGNAFQDATTTATFTFDAEQTANNP